MSALDITQKEADLIGYPLMLQTDVWGGGRKMSVVRKASELSNYLVKPKARAKLLLVRPRFLKKILKAQDTLKSRC